jgi:hypothetical protein
LQRARDRGERERIEANLRGLKRAAMSVWLDGRSEGIELKAKGLEVSKGSAGQGQA